jgi:response regulator RpfG family c-di-GMP phosphodiesterase
MMAQWGFDVVSVEDYINDHKKQRSLLLARSTLEYSNKLLHQYSSEQTSNYKEINVELDKYTRAFDVIDVLYQSLRTSMNAVNTYENVSDRISDYKKLLNDFNSQVVKRKHIELADTMLISINIKAIANIAKEGEYLFKSLSDLVLYATGAAACSTADLLVVMESINTSLDNIEKMLNTAYFDTWRYIQLRMGYWKEKVYRTKTKKEIIDDAFERWRKAGKLEK